MNQSFHNQIGKHITISTEPACAHCGKATEISAKFCENCGKSTASRKKCCRPSNLKVDGPFVAKGEPPSTLLRLAITASLPMLQSIVFRTLLSNQLSNASHQCSGDSSSHMLLAQLCLKMLHRDNCWQALREICTTVESSCRCPSIKGESERGNP